MTASTACDFLQRIKDSVECPICYLIYDKPKSLPCGHTFCQDCIQSASYRPIDYSDYYDDSDDDYDDYQNHHQIITVSSAVYCCILLYCVYTLCPNKK